MTSYKLVKHIFKVAITTCEIIAHSTVRIRRLLLITDFEFNGLIIILIFKDYSIRTLFFLYVFVALYLYVLVHLINNIHANNRPRWNSRKINNPTIPYYK